MEIPATGIDIRHRNLVILARTPEQKASAEAMGFAAKLVQMPCRKMTAEEIAKADFEREQSRLANDPNFRPYTGIADNDPRNLWGEVVRDGKIVAKIYKSGCVETARNNVTLDPAASTAVRAQQVVAQLGGTLVMAASRSTYYSARHMALPSCDWMMPATKPA